MKQIRVQTKKLTRSKGLQKNQIFDKARIFITQGDIKTSNKLQPSFDYLDFLSSF